MNQVTVYWRPGELYQKINNSQTRWNQNNALIAMNQINQIADLRQM